MHISYYWRQAQYGACIKKSVCLALMKCSLKITGPVWFQTELLSYIDRWSPRHEYNSLLTLILSEYDLELFVLSMDYLKYLDVSLPLSLEISPKTGGLDVIGCQ